MYLFTWNYLSVSVVLEDTPVEFAIAVALKGKPIYLSIYLSIYQYIYLSIWNYLSVSILEDTPV